MAFKRGDVVFVNRVEGNPTSSLVGRTFTVRAVKNEPVAHGWSKVILGDKELAAYEVTAKLRLVTRDAKREKRCAFCSSLFVTEKAAQKYCAVECAKRADALKRWNAYQRKQQGEVA